MVELRPVESNGMGSIPIIRLSFLLHLKIKNIKGGVAQSVEQRAFNLLVLGSIPNIPILNVNFFKVG